MIVRQCQLLAAAGQWAAAGGVRCGGGGGAGLQNMVGITSTRQFNETVNASVGLSWQPEAGLGLQVGAAILPPAGRQLAGGPVPALGRALSGVARCIRGDPADSHGQGKVICGCRSSRRSEHGGLVLCEE